MMESHHVVMNASQINVICIDLCTCFFYYGGVINIMDFTGNFGFDLT